MGEDKMKKLIIAIILIAAFLVPTAGYAQQSTDKDIQTLRIQLVLNSILWEYPDWAEKYEEGVFDCSEMTAYVQYVFSLYGVKSDYCQSDFLYHCWLRVGDIHIECVELAIMDSPPVAPDIRYNRKMRPDEIDWWNSI
jgi:hypothetical protein